MFSKIKHMSVQILKKYECVISTEGKEAPHLWLSPSCMKKEVAAITGFEVAAIPDFEVAAITGFEVAEITGFEVAAITAILWWLQSL